MSCKQSMTNLLLFLWQNKYFHNVRLYWGHTYSICSTFSVIIAVICSLNICFKDSFLAVFLLLLQIVLTLRFMHFNLVFILAPTLFGKK